VKLVESVGATPVEAACVIELPELGGRSKLEGMPVFSILQLDESFPSHN
jgi:adenine/guanine phosphoribosyltransferase-like PRPP-binding protein